MATHSGILAWKIPWTEKPGSLQVHGVAKSNTTPFKFLFHSGPYFLLYIQDLYLAIIFCVLYFYWNIIDVQYDLSFRCAP